MEFAGLGGHQGYPRLLLGMAPVLFAWPTLALQPTMALITQWVGFTALWWADSRATNAGWSEYHIILTSSFQHRLTTTHLAPKWYSQYRFYLSFLVGTCIIGTLASTSYWGPVAGHGLLSHDLNLIRAERKRVQSERMGIVGGDVEAVDAGEEGDSYVRIRKKERKEDEEGGEDEGGKEE